MPITLKDQELKTRLAVRYVHSLASTYLDSVSHGFEDVLEVPAVQLFLDSEYRLKYDLARSTGMNRNKLITAFYRMCFGKPYSIYLFQGGQLYGIIEAAEKSEPHKRLLEHPFTETFVDEWNLVKDVAASSLAYLYERDGYLQLHGAEPVSDLDKKHLFTSSSLGYAFNAYLNQNGYHKLAVIGKHNKNRLT